MKQVGLLLVSFVLLSFLRVEKPLKTDNIFDINSTSEQALNTNLSEIGNIIMVQDSAKLPLYYYQKVFTAVCYNHECKPADILLYWDAAGNFLGFQVPTEAPLTKNKHHEFSDYDYFLLYTILNNPYSVLGKISQEDMLNGNTNAAISVDAVSGATTVSDKNSVVSGAVFTCYTLWHLVYDKTVTNAIRKNSNKYFKSTPTHDIKTFKSTNLQTIHPGKLSLLLSDFNKKNKLKKRSSQKAITANLDSIGALKALLVNNYANKQIFVFPEIEARLAKCEINNTTFTKMLNR